MNWGEFKKCVESEGATDATEVKTLRMRFYGLDLISGYVAGRDESIRFMRDTTDPNDVGLLTIGEDD